MTSDPYTPDETELAHCYAGVMEESGENFETAQADAERGIAHIKAEAWDDGYAKGALDDLLDRNPPSPNPHRQKRKTMSDELRDRVEDTLRDSGGYSWRDKAQAIIDEFGLTHEYRTAYSQDHPDGENQKRVVGKWERQ